LLDVLDNTPDQNGRTGLMWAAAKGEATLIQIMCRHGADPNYKVTLKTFSEDQDKQIPN
jgi:ankyrin repeat protein